MQGRHELAGAHIRSGGKLLCETVYHQRKGVLQHQVLGSQGDKECYVSLELLSRIYVALGPEPNRVRRHLFSPPLPTKIMHS